MRGARRCGLVPGALALALFCGAGAFGEPAEQGEAPSAGVGAVFTLDQRYLHAASEGEAGEVKRALELGADPDAIDGLGRNALLLAVRGKGSLALVDTLAERGVPCDRPDSGGRSAISYAAARGDLELLRDLASRGAQSDRVDQQGRSPLFHAVARDRIEAARFLIAAGAKVDRQDLFGDTPLIAACAKGQDAMAALLVASGADPAHRDREGRTARERAAPDTPACSAEPSLPPASY